MPSAIYACEFEGCGKSFKKLSKLHRHQTSHSDARHFSCSVCSKTYKRREHLNVHRLSHNQNEEERKPHACPECGKRFVSAYHLNRHMKIHSEEYPYHCTFDGCSAQFTKHSKLREHMCVHNGQSPHVCDVCNKQLSSSSKLKLHKEIHESNKEMRYVCSLDDCGERFAKWSLLQKHVSSHRSVCSICSKTFSRPSVLQEHMSTHNPNRILVPCSVEGCNRFFTSSKSLKVHIRSFHDSLRPFTCKSCGKSFAHKHLLVRHLKLHESKSTEKNISKSKSVAENQILDASFHSISGKTRDPDLYKYACPWLHCECRFKRKYDLERHETSCHNKLDPLKITSV